MIAKIAAPQMIVLLAAFSFATPAFATTSYVTGHVIQIAPEVMPTTILFNLDSVGSCTQTGNGWLSFSAVNSDTNKAVFATVMAALLSQRVVWMSYDPATCIVSAVHLN